MSVLELFPNLAIYRLQTNENIVDLPVGVYDITAINVKTLRVVPTRLIRNSPFEVGDICQVDQVEGKLVQTTDKFTDVLTTDQNAQSTLIRIYKPSQIVSFGSVSKRYEILSEPGEESVITGFNNDLTWNPTYIVILSEDVNTILKLSLVGQLGVNVAFLDFDVDRIVFNTKNVLRPQSRQPMRSSMARSVGGESVQSLSVGEDSESREQDIRVETVYKIDGPITISPEMSFPLDSWSNLKTKRIYFLKVQSNSKPLYGYDFEVPNFIPSGSVRVQDAELNFVGMTTLEVIGKRVFLKVGTEENLFATTIVETRSVDVIVNGESEEESEESWDKEGEKTKERQDITNFGVSVFSKFAQPVMLILELDFYGALLEARPKQPDERLPGKLLWKFTIKPGKNEFKEEVVSTY